MAHLLSRTRRITQSSSDTKLIHGFTHAGFKESFRAVVTDLRKCGTRVEFCWTRVVTWMLNNSLQHTARHCNTLRYTATHIYVAKANRSRTTAWCVTSHQNVDYDAVWCSVMLCVLAVKIKKKEKPKIRKSNTFVANRASRWRGPSPAVDARVVALCLQRQRQVSNEHLQCAAVCCSVLHCVAESCQVTQESLLFIVFVYMYLLFVCGDNKWSRTCACSVLPCVAECRIVLQRVAVSCQFA